MTQTKAQRQARIESAMTRAIRNTRIGFGILGLTAIVAVTLLIVATPAAAAITAVIGGIAGGATTTIGAKDQFTAGNKLVRLSRQK